MYQVLYLYQKVHNSFTYPPSYILDDEMHFRCPDNCTCVRLSIYGPGNTDDCTKVNHANKFPRQDITRNGEELENQMAGVYHARLIDVSGNSDVFKNIESLLKPFTSTTFLEVLNISSCHISKLSAKLFQTTIFLTELDISFNSIESLTAGLFRPLTRLHTLRLKGNYAILHVETASFAGLSSLQHLELSHLHLGHISEYAFAGVSVNEFSIAYSIIESMDSNSFGHLMTSDMNVKTSKIIHFSKLIFKDLLNVSLLITSSFRFCCIRPYYLSENKCIPQRTTLSSCNDLIANENGRYFLWISALLVIVSNLLSIVSNLKFSILKRNLGHRFFVCNLSFSDLLFGVYLCIIIAHDMLSRGEYASFEHTWRATKSCLSAIISSSTTVLVRPCLLLLISCARFLVIAYPSGQVRITRTFAITSVALIWSVMLSVAVFFTLMNEPLSPTGLCIGIPFKYDSSPEWLVKVTLPLMVNVSTLVLCFYGFRGIVNEGKGEILREKSGTLREKGGSLRKEGGILREKGGKLRAKGRSLREKDGSSREKGGSSREKSETTKASKALLKRSDDLKTSWNIMLLVTITALSMTLVLIAGMYEKSLQNRTFRFATCTTTFTHISLVSLIWDVANSIALDVTLPNVSSHLDYSVCLQEIHRKIK